MYKTKINGMLDKMRNEFIKQVKLSKHVLGAWNLGSETYGLCDEHSDVDVILLIEGDSFSYFVDSLDGYMKQISDEVLLCWPEGFNCSKIINNGYLLVKEDNISI